MIRRKSAKRSVLTSAMLLFIIISCEVFPKPHLLFPFLFCATDPDQRRAPGVRQGEALSAGDHVQGHCVYRGREVCEPRDEEAVHSQPHRAGDEGHPLLCEGQQEHQAAGEERQISGMCFSCIQLVSLMHYHILM